MNNMRLKKIFFKQGIQVTTFCLASVFILFLLGASQRVILVLFNMAVMTMAATFSPDRKTLLGLFEGLAVVSISIILGGIIGYYFASMGHFIAIVYAALAFLIPKTKSQVNVFVTGALMFLVFVSLPFQWNQAIQYSGYLLVLVVVLPITYLLFHSYIYRDMPLKR